MRHIDVRIERLIAIIRYNNWRSFVIFSSNIGIAWWKWHRNIAMIHFYFYFISSLLFLLFLVSDNLGKYGCINFFNWHRRQILLEKETIGSVEWFRYRIELDSHHVSLSRRSIRWDVLTRYHCSLKSGSVNRFWSGTPLFLWRWNRAACRGRGPKPLKKGW